MKTINYTLRQESKAFIAFILITIVANGITIIIPPFAYFAAVCSVFTGFTGVYLYDKAIRVSAYQFSFDRAAEVTKETNDLAAITDFDDATLMAMAEKRMSERREYIRTRAAEILEERKTKKQ